ncbi:Glutathione S-transferase 1 [Orchesella cincta]|uniref:glutathione transferase n=1 Tax=Orchesella cincta TaxID=48709 RepID=A0A1D2N3Z5_ORCCI|nr:Glutathione S-transferase 1 [Orchesella cincta]
MPENYKLTYFNMKGMGEPARLIFAYAGVEYEDNRIERPDWPALKKNFPWGQLPVLQVGDRILSQSNAICRYLGQKFNLNGRDDWESAKIDELADALADFRKEIMTIHGDSAEKDETKKAALTANFIGNTVPRFFGNMESAIAKNGDSPYLVGKNLTWVDLQMAHFLDMFDAMIPNVLDTFPKLRKLKQNVFKIPSIAQWIEKRPKTAF